YVPETLWYPLQQLEDEYFRAQHDPQFQRELTYYLREFVGRPSPLYFAERLTRELGGARIYLKREDLLHTGAHKINNAIGQALLAQSMGKRRGGGQAGAERAAAVHAASRTLKDAINEALRDWVTNVRGTHYILGSVLGPDPYPRMVRDFHRPIGEETRRQLRRAIGRSYPDVAIACVGGGSNAMGLFSALLDEARTRLIGVEAGGTGDALGQHAARFSGGGLGVLHGTRTFVL